jgi:hypothetical protein
MFKTLAALCGVLAVVGASPAGAAGIRGEYVEARTNDVFTGPCFSNAEIYAEIYITGHQAVMVWKVTEGSYQGVNLAGLSVAAAVKGTSTFDADTEDQAQSVLIVDKSATPRQHEALVALAKALGGDRMKHVVEVKTSPMALTIESHELMSPGDAKPEEHKGHVMPKTPRALFVAPGLAEVSTRPLDEGDHKCGNEVVAFPPLSKGVDVLPAYTLGNSFQGKGLNTRWNDPNARSSLVGHFAL